jgi:hypothetical protein
MFKVNERVQAAFRSSISFLLVFFPIQPSFFCACFFYLFVAFHLCPILLYFVLYIFSPFSLYSSLVCSMFILPFFLFLFLYTCLISPSYTPSFPVVPPISGTVLNSLQLQTPDVSGIECYTLLPKIPSRRLVSFVAKEGY